MLPFTSSSSLLLLSLASLSGLVSAVDATSSARCYTAYASKETPVKTSWKTHYSRCTTTSTSTVVVTTRATIPTITSTTTTYVTVSNGTSTVPTASGFLPIRSTLPDTSYDGSTGPAPPAKKRSLGQVQSASGPAAFGLVGLKPQSVVCHSWTRSKCLTTTTTLTSTTTLPATISAASVVVNKTVTSTTIVPVATVYPACNIDNIANFVNGYAITNAHQNTGSSELWFTSADSGYDCCVAALLMSPNGQVYGYAPNSNGYPGGACFARSSGSCANGQASNSWSPEVGGPYNFTVGNLGCGKFDQPAVAYVSPQ